MIGTSSGRLHQRHRDEHAEARRNQADDRFSAHVAVLLLLGAILGGRPPQQRIAASIAAAVCAVERGAFIVRVHDVEQTVDAVKTWWAVRNESVTAA